MDTSVKRRFNKSLHLTALSGGRQVFRGPPAPLCAQRAGRQTGLPVPARQTLCPFRVFTWVIAD